MKFTTLLVSVGSFTTAHAQIAGSAPPPPKPSVAPLPAASASPSAAPGVFPPKGFGGFRPQGTGIPGGFSGLGGLFGGSQAPGPAVLTPVDGGLAVGPHKSGYVEDTTLPRHTIFAPINPPSTLKMPVLIWGNGACSGNGTLFRRSLWEVASHGIFAIANGAANGGGGQTTAALQKEALDWLDKNAGVGKYANVDKTRIAAAGQSCGGLETYRVWDDKRISYLGIFNSGEFRNSSTAPKITKPIFYFLGGPTDIAYANVSLCISVTYHNLVVLMHMGCSRASVISKLSLKVLPAGRGTWPSATWQPGHKPMEASLARLSGCGWIGSCVAMLLAASSSWVTVQRLTDGKLKSMIWTSFLKSLRFSDDLRVEVSKSGCPLLDKDSSRVFSF
jgi:hypothetical protein